MNDKVGNNENMEKQQSQIERNSIKGREMREEAEGC